MYDYIIGTVTFRQPTCATIEVNEVGYYVRIPLSTYNKLAEKSLAKVYLHLYQSEDGSVLYGFATREERDLFMDLISVQGVGPKMALRALSGLGVADMREAVARGDVEKLSQIKGIGRKTAERIVLDLREKMRKSVATREAGEARVAREVVNDAIEALVALGYGRGESEQAVERSLRSLGPDATVEELVKKAIQGVS